MGRYDKQTRRKVRGALRQLLQSGVTDRDELAKALTTQGFTAPDGGALTKQTVQSQLQNAGLSRKRRLSKAKAPTVHAEPRDEGDQMAMIDLILGSNFTANRKVEMLKGLRGLNGIHG